MSMIAPLIGAGLNLAGSLFGGGDGGAQEDLDDDRKRVNKNQKKQAKRRFKRAEREFTLNDARLRTDFFWEQAQIEQNRLDQAQASRDQAWQGRQLITNAAADYRRNAAALRDQYVTNERLRAQQEGHTYETESLLREIEAQQQMANYLEEVQVREQQAIQAAASAEADGLGLMGSIVAQTLQENAAFEAGVVDAAVQSAQQGAGVAERTAGSRVAGRVLQDQLRQQYRGWEQNEMALRGREARIGALNATIRGPLAAQLAQLSLQTGSALEDMRFTQRAFQTQQTQDDRILRDLVMPTFSVAQRQYQRELGALQDATDATLFTANLPYRRGRIFDALQPVPGMPPEYEAPIDIQSSGIGGAAGGAFGSYLTAAISGFRQFGGDQYIRNQFGNRNLAPPPTSSSGNYGIGGTAVSGFGVGSPSGFNIGSVALLPLTTTSSPIDFSSGSGAGATAIL
jgi:hypothetical protein